MVPLSQEPGTVPLSQDPGLAWQRGFLVLNEFVLLSVGRGVGKGSREGEIHLSFRILFSAILHVLPVLQRQQDVTA